MEIGVLCDDFFIVRQIAASLGDDGIEIVDCVEVGVGERLIDDRPQVFGGLELRAVGRLIVLSRTSMPSFLAITS
jgi:hypothetical protein